MTSEDIHPWYTKIFRYESNGFIISFLFGGNQLLFRQLEIQEGHRGGSLHIIFEWVLWPVGCCQIKGKMQLEASATIFIHEDQKTLKMAGNSFQTHAKA